MKIAPTVPVIGPLAYRRTVGGLASALKSGNLQVIGELCTIVRAGPDMAARAIAGDALGSLSSQDAIDVFCREVVIHENPALEKIAIRMGYAPSEPGFAALFLYITRQEEALYRFDPDPHHPVLACGYATAPDEIKTRALRNSSDTRWSRVLAHALIGTDPAHGAGIWTNGEWEVVIASLIHEKAWEVLWLLVVSAPPSLAVTAMNAMKMAGWKPDGDGMQVFEDLVRGMPHAWVHPVPEKPLVSMQNQGGQYMRLAFSRDGTLIASGNCDGRVDIWQTASARLILSCATNAGSIGFLAFASDNTYLISGGNNGTLTCSGIPSGNTIWSFTNKDHPISCFALSGNGDEVVVGDDRGGMIRIGCRTGKTLLAVQGHPCRVTAISPAPDGTGICFGHTDGTICCRESANGAEIWAVPGNGDAVRALEYTGQGGQLFGVCEYSLPVLRDGRTGEPVRTYLKSSGHPPCFEISAKNQMVVIGSDDHVLRFWNWQDKNPTAELPFYNRRPTCCACTPDGTLAVAGCNEGTIYFFGIPEGDRIKEFRGYKQAVISCAISPDGSILATTGGDGTVALRRIPTGEILRTLRRPSGAITALALISGTRGTGIVAGTADGRVCIFSMEGGKLIRSIDMFTPSVKALAVSPDGAYLACAGKDTSLRIWDLAKDGLVATCDPLTTTVRCLAFLPDAATFISCGWDGVVKMWGVPGGKQEGALNGHSSVITCCCADPKGRFIVTGSNDTTLRIWQQTGERKSFVIRDAKHEVGACAISPDGSILAAAGTDPVIHLYSLPEGTGAGTIPQIPGRPTALVFTDDGLALAAGYDHGTLAFYALCGHSLIRTLPAHTGAVTGIVAIRGNDLIVTSGTDGMIHIFRVPFMRPLSRTTLADLTLAREQEQVAGTDTMAKQWRFLCSLLSIRFQSEIELCPTYRDAGIYDIQIVG
jgi:WD40 repeat protein